MRFRELELIRYGGFADRLLAFGDGGIDLHIVVGPNEAGKSTTLHAIGDFLFGFGGQSIQGWRWGNNELRVRAVLEDGAKVVEAIRRKGNKDTLLAADGSPLRSDPLVPLLSGVDRAAFERMYGLTHQRLRDGGDAILLGRDDAARITLEAGTGVSGIGREMDSLSNAAAELFKPGGSVPVVNRLMRERGDAQRNVREHSISETQWSDHRRSRQEAEERKASLIEEAEALEREASKLERIGRARAPLARLAHDRAAIERLGPATDLPIDAAERLTSARAERLAATERIQAHTEELRRLDQGAADLRAPEDLLRHADRISALDERRPVIERAERDLLRRRAERDRVDERIAAARREAQLPAEVGLPTAGWRRRADQLLQQRREAASSSRTAAARKAELEQSYADLVGRRGSLTSVPELEAIKSALEACPVDGSVRLRQLEQEGRRKRARAGQALAALMPWTGDFASLRAADPPGVSEGISTAQAAEELRSEIRTARREADAHLAEAIRADDRAAALTASGTLPTAEIVSDARHRRDALLAEVLAGLTGHADELLSAVAKADDLADRRDGEAERVADHAAAIAAGRAARNLESLARARAEASEAELGAIEQAWSDRLGQLGFMRPTAPGDHASWLERRAQALAADEEARGVEADTAELREALDRSRGVLARALSASAGEMPEDHDGLVAFATALVRRASDAMVRQEELEARIEETATAIASFSRQTERDFEFAAEREHSLLALLGEVGLPVAGGESALVDALASMEGIVEDVVTRAGLERQIEGMARDVRSFEADLTELLSSLGRPSQGASTRMVAELAQEARAAATAQERLDQVAAERARLLAELERAEGRFASAEAQLAELASRAGVQEERLLDAVVEAAKQRSDLAVAIVSAEQELVVLDDGSGIDALVVAVAAMTADDEAAARRGVEERRQALAAAREEVGRALAEADDVWTRAARDSAAADAQQAVAETSAALAAAAESHLEAAAAAALLRWVLDRHRQTNQAPLIARAGAMFETVTGGSFQGLMVEYDENDRPAIVAVRGDGGKIGVEGLSEGTRDQLYLALRLGSIESSAHRLPIVCDDLLITADDVRAGAMLEVLAAASSSTQVILFTHHEHLVDVARASIGIDRFMLHRLRPTLTAAA